MTTMRYSLLDDALISVRSMDGAVREMTLPAIFVALLDDDIASFEALQAHQKQPWFSFLVQVAAMAVARAGRADAPTDPAAWRDLLVELADGSEVAWCLVVDDLSKPAFMQPPVPEGSLEDADFKADVSSPDALDRLITTKTHDIKRKRIVAAAPQHWLLSLVSLQTMEGFLGRGNYGIVRMNGGFGSRPQVGLAPGLEWGARFCRDLTVLLANRGSIAEANEFSLRGVSLVWLVPWDGQKSSAIALDDCDPYFIEICRRLRFLTEHGDVVCWRANSSGQRIEAPDDLNGRTGDPWTPIDIGDAKALTLGGSGYTYELLQELWFGGDYQRPPALKFQRSDPKHVYLVATTLVRGQGKTKGLHSRSIPVPREATQLFGGDAGRKKLAKRAERRVQLAAKVQSDVLRGPTFALVYGGRSPSDPNWDKINPWIEAFDARVDARFFDDLWTSVQQHMSDDEADVHWQQILRDLAEKQYVEIRDSIPLPSIHRYRVLSQADGQFWARLRSTLDRAFDTNDSTASSKEDNDEKPALA